MNFLLGEFIAFSPSSHPDMPEAITPQVIEGVVYLGYNTARIILMV